MSHPDIEAYKEYLEEEIAEEVRRVAKRKPHVAVIIDAGEKLAILQHKLEAVNYLILTKKT